MDSGEEQAQSLHVWTQASSEHDRHDFLCRVQNDAQDSQEWSPAPDG